MKKPDDMPQELWDKLPDELKGLLGNATAIAVGVEQEPLDFSDPNSAHRWLSKWVDGVVRVLNSDEDFDMRITLLSANAGMWETLLDESKSPADVITQVDEMTELTMQRMEFLRLAMIAMVESPEGAPSEWKPHLPTIIKLIEADIYETGPTFCAVLAKTRRMAQHWLDNPLEAS